MLKIATTISILIIAISMLADEPRPKVIIYKAPGCRPCQMAIEAAKDWPVDLYSTYDCPTWVKTCPTFHWQDRHGKWLMHEPRVWDGREAERTRKLILRSWGK